MTPLLIALAALFGLIVGSFLNVCVYRMPRGESVVRPRSHCPGCKATISWYENIPLFSFIFLRGKCRHCGRAISLRYPLIEILSAVLSVVILLRFPTPLQYSAYFLLLSAPLLVIIFIDIEHLLIPDAITLPGIVFGVAVHVLLGDGPLLARFIESGLGILIGAGILYLLSWIYERLRGRIGLGLGDVKLAAMLGAFFGGKAIIFILLVSSLLGTLIGLVYLAIKRKDLKQPIPYGPFLALAAWLYLFYGPQLLDWYLTMTRRLYS